MKLVKRIVAFSIFFSLLMSLAGYAAELSWEDVQGNHDGSVLLSREEISSTDSYYSVKRGDFMSGGVTEIINGQNGSMTINIDTYAHYDVDRIFHSVFLDKWDADEQDWTQVGSWDFSKSKEETTNGKLSSLTTSFTLTGYETNKYYRVRGLHGVEYNDEIEACATETNGVLITDGPT